MKKGFTLIELLVVITIIAILSAVGLATFSNARKRALDSKMIADVKQAQLVMEQNFNDATNFYIALPASGFETGAIPSDITITYTGAAPNYTAYCVVSSVLNNTGTGNCNNTCAFAPNNTRFCAKNLR